LHVVHPGRQSRKGLIPPMAVQGVVQTYDPVSGVGVVVRDDDRSEVYLRPGSLRGSIFRTLRQGQRIVFDLAEEDGTAYVSNVRVGQDQY
jgi:CspA family cold shock protein